MRSNKQTDGRRYLQCSNRHVSKDACIGSFISVPKLEQAVIKELNRMSMAYLDKDELEQNVTFNNNLKEKQEALKSTISTYEKKIAEYTKGIRELYLDKVKGILSEQDYLDLSKDFVTQKERLIRFDIDLVKKHGYSPEILVIFTELPEGKTIKTEEKHIAKNDKMAEIV